MQIAIDILGDISLANVDFDRNCLETIAEKINDAIGQSDYRIANMESPFCFGSSAVRIKKSGPNLKMQEGSVAFFEKLQIDCYTLANNHLGDYGEKGIIDTIKVLENLNKDYVGSSDEYERTHEAIRKIIKGIKLSFISVCENEFGIAEDGKMGAAGYDRESIRRILDKESSWSDFAIVIFHGGTENYPYPTPEQKYRYRDLIDMGADAVIGMHSHCPQGYEIYHNAPIIYSVGNFFFPRDCETFFEGWRYGYVARLKLQKDSLTEFEIVPYKFDTCGHDFSLIDKKDFLPYLEVLSDVIQDDEHLKNLFKGWTVVSGKKYFDNLCKQIITAQDEKRNCLAKNLFSCEAHRELLKTYLTILYESTEKAYLPYIENIKRDMRISDKIGEKRICRTDNTDTVIWGIGKKAENLFYKLKSQKRQIVFVDKDILKQGLKFLDEEIISPEDAIRQFGKACFYICTSPESRDGIVSVLKENGIRNGQIFFEE
ncbi:MAG: CapA family protein [Lachnospiraceae bacterium]|nr:CapA family protein [Lachnospiraceae bacterium]